MFLSYKNAIYIIYLSSFKIIWKLTIFVTQFFDFVFFFNVLDFQVFLFLITVIQFILRYFQKI